MSRLPGPRRLHRALARAEVITWTLLLAGMVLKYLTHTTELGVRIGGGVHGLVFLAYCAVTFLVATDRRWRPGTVALGLVSAVVPYLSLWFERRVEGQGLLAEHWRLRDEAGRGLRDRTVALVLHRPVPASLVVLVLLALVFSGLLALGPPTQWGS